jgi:hypothetical protein
MKSLAVIKITTKSAGVTEVPASMTEVVAVDEGSSVGDVCIVVVDHSPVVPVGAPGVPSPPKPSE